MGVKAVFPGAASPPKKTGELKMEKAIVRISDKEYNLKFTVGFWRNVKEKCEITRNNLESKLNDNFGVNATEIVFYGVLYGLGTTESEMPITRKEIEEQLDYSLSDAIEQAIINGSTKAEKRLIDIARLKVENQMSELEEEIPSKKKSQSKSTKKT